MTRKIKGKLAELGISQNELAAKLGFTVVTMSHKLNEKADWKLGELKQVQDYLKEKSKKHYTIDELVE